MVEVPKRPVMRARVRGDRIVDIDFRGIRNPKSPFNGKLNPSKGAERLFLTPEHLQCMVDEYFESCNGPLIDKYGQIVYDKYGDIVKVQVQPWTVSGMALKLGLKTESLRKYRMGRVDSILDEMRAETSDALTFAKVLETAKQKIESYAERRLYDNAGQRGAQFVLDCQFGWVNHKDRAEAIKAATDAEIKRREFELKKQLLDSDGEDSSITINIVRGHKEDTDEE